MNKHNPTEQRKKIIQIRVGINKTEIKKQHTKIKETK